MALVGMPNREDVSTLGLTTESASVTTITSKENLARIPDNLKEGIVAHDLQRR